MFGRWREKPSFKYEVLAACVLWLVAWVYFFQWGNTNVFLLFAAILWIYMAMNIWANDVANNMWPAVGAKALTLTGAIIIAAIFEASWAIIAGWDVVNTIKWWIIDSSMITNPQEFIYIMTATLLGAALWINIATYFKAPVSATHSIIWWLLWWGLTAYWAEIVDWSVVWKIAASWIISPLLWWIIAALIMLSIRKTIMKQKHIDKAAKNWLPIYVWLMAAVFSIYLMLKWLKPLVKSSEWLSTIVTPTTSLFIGVVIGISTIILTRLYLKKHKSLLRDNKKYINKLFNLPLICAVALLSFAHGANDVANAIWPLVAINETIQSAGLNTESVSIPFWIMFLWAAGLSLGLMIFGSRLIATVGWEITKLNQVRAFSVALAAAITVILASQLGLPVSSTHIALGWIFGVGLLREHIKRSNGKNKSYIEKWMIKNIALAWVITLPVSAIISSIAFLSLMQLNG